MFEVTVEETFAAGHALRNYKGKCENVHGHNYKVRGDVRGENLDATGLLVDFVEVKRLMHARWWTGWITSFLNELPPFDVINPSAENMAQVLLRRDRGGPERGRRGE